jgi:hypothetical protein
MKHKIYRLEDADECHNVKTGEAIPYLTYLKPGARAKLISTGGRDATLEELVELCDHNAEAVNAHDYCGTHRLLGAVLYRSLGRVEATVIMLKIATFGGLHGMNGVCTSGDAYKELGVGESGCDWDGKYE